MSTENEKTDAQPATTPDAQSPQKPAQIPLPKEIGGKDGPEPTRYGDWQHKGRVSDF
jgi:hypothetical protein